MTVRVAVDSPEPPAYTAHIQTLVFRTFETYHTLMGLTDWNIKLFWTTVPDNKVMSTTAEPEYYQADIDIDLPDIDEYLTDYVRHELLHVILWSYTDTAEALAFKKAKPVLRKLEERVVSDLERMPLWEHLHLKT